MILFLVSLAWADIPPPDAEPCGGDESLGKPCEYGGEAGVCQKATRSRATPNGMVDVGYVACRPAPTGDAAPASPATPAAAPTTGPVPAGVPEEARCATSIAGGGLLALVALAGLTRRRRR